MSTPQHLDPYDSVLDTVGWTPLIRLGRIGSGVRTPIYAKAEYVNPGGSVKDRIGLAIIEDAERRGEHGAGTGGTVSGAGKYLKEKNPSIKVLAGDPVGSLYTQFHRSRRLGEGHPYKVEGIGGDKIPSTIWFDWIDEFRQVSDRTSLTMA